MKPSIVAILASTSLGLFASPALAQTAQDPDVIMPSVEECQALYDRVFAGVAAGDDAARESALATLDVETRDEMEVCLTLLDEADDAEGDDPYSSDHDTETHPQ
jgi:hypothetical protein